jgi:hypothetical protein
MSVYDLYKPLRNLLRQYPLLESLSVVHAYTQYLQFSRPLPSDIDVNPIIYARHKPERQIYEWQLDLLAREIILNCPTRGTKTLRSWPQFAKAINTIKDLEEKVYLARRPLFQDNILLEMFRVAHRQFPWQRPPNEDTLLRYFKIFNTAEFDPIIRNAISIAAPEIYTIGLGFAGHFMRSFAYYLDSSIEVREISTEGFSRFVDHFSTDVPSLRQMAAAVQSYDQDYAYTFNPLRKYPLVRVILNGRNAVVSPIPTFLFRRFTDGVYYEICDAKGFAEAFGRSFQKYVGEMLSKANYGERLTIVAEQPYHVGKDRKDSVDWIVSDSTGDLFIECKTKKLRVEAKIALTSTTVLNDDLDKMAGFIVQIYKTLFDAINGRYGHWLPQQDKPLYPVIVTLEEWFAFGDKIFPAIDEIARRKLAELRMSPAIVDTYPYTICSAEDFELVAQIMQSTGIHSVMSKKTVGEHLFWPLYSFLGTVFKDELAQVRKRDSLFVEDMGNINWALKD